MTAPHPNWASLVYVSSIYVAACYISQYKTLFISYIQCYVPVVCGIVACCGDKIVVVFAQKLNFITGFTMPEKRGKLCSLFYTWLEKSLQNFGKFWNQDLGFSFSLSGKDYILFRPLFLLKSGDK